MYVNFRYPTGISERLNGEQICDFSQLNKITKIVYYSVIQDFCFQFQIFTMGH